MLFRKIIPVLLVIPIILITIISDTGCANIIPPAGGPKDTLPPQLTKAEPADSTKNFAGNRITLSFNKYIDLQNVQQNLVVSPVPKIAPSVERKLTSVIIKLKDTLQPNTTYALNFGDAIRDINEGNILKNFTYIFSTGTYIDSLQVRGRIILAETGTADSTLIVMLHRNGDDSAVVKEKPRYVTRVNGKGYFTFRNLPAGTFYLYALKDESGTYRFNGHDQLFAFADKPVTAGSDTAMHILYAYHDKEGESISKSAATHRPAAPPKEKRLIVQTNLEGNQQDLLRNFILKFEAPLKTFDSSKISFTSDSSHTPVTAFHFVSDSTGKEYTLNYPWKENTLYRLILDKDFAKDTFGRQLLRADTIKFTSKKNTDYGSVRIRFRKLDLTTNPVLLFVLNDKVIKTYPLTGNEFYQQMFAPGDYTLRILFDDNKNGQWDPGIFFGKHQQPELIKPFDRKINVKPNWENEYEVDAPARFP